MFKEVCFLGRSTIFRFFFVAVVTVLVCGLSAGPGFGQSPKNHPASSDATGMPTVANTELRTTGLTQASAGVGSSRLAEFRFNLDPSARMFLVNAGYVIGARKISLVGAVTPLVEVTDSQIREQSLESVDIQYSMFSEKLIINFNSRRGATQRYELDTRRLGLITSQDNDWRTGW